MKNRITALKITAIILSAGFVLSVTGSVNVFAQDGPSSVNKHAPENISGSLEGNSAELLSSWRFLSGLAMRLMSGNTAEAELELLSGNSPELLSGNAPELLSGNSARLLSDNDPHLLSGNTLFSGNSVEIRIVESGNAPTLGSLAKSLTNLPSQRVRAEQDKLKDALQARLKAAEERARAIAAKERAQADAMTAELSKMRRHIAELTDQNAKLKLTIEEMQNQLKTSSAQR